MLLPIPGGLPSIRTLLNVALPLKPGQPSTLRGKPPQRHATAKIDATNTFHVLSFLCLPFPWLYSPRGEHYYNLFCNPTCSFQNIPRSYSPPPERKK